MIKLNEEKLTSFLKEKGLSKTQFCKECKISYSTLEKFLTGQCRHCRLDGVLRILNYTKLSYNELWEEKNP